MFSEFGKGATSEAKKYPFRAEKCPFRAANVWRRCAHYLFLPLVTRCLETIDVCIDTCLFLCLLSPVLFTVYINRLIRKLQKSEV